MEEVTATTSTEVKDEQQSLSLCQDIMKEYTEAIAQLKADSEHQNAFVTKVMKVYYFLYEQQVVPIADSTTINLLLAISNIIGYETEAIMRKYCFSLLWSLSDHTNLHQYFFEPPQFHLIPKLIHSLQFAFNDDEKYLILVFFHNLIAFSTHTIHLLTRPESRLLTVIALLLTENTPQKVIVTHYFHHIVSILWNISEMGDDDDSEQIILTNLHKHTFLILQHLIEIQDLWIISEQMKEPDPARLMISDRFSRLLNFFMNLASRDVSLSNLHQLGLVPVMIPIARDQRFGSNRLKAIFIISFLIGRREYNELAKPVSSPNDLQSRRKQLTPCVSTASETGESFRHIELEDIETIIHVFELTLQGKGGDDYPAGTFCLRLIVKACLTISQSDSNKSLFLSTSIISLLLQVLSMFQGNEAEIPLCGGGGKDVLSAILAIDTLLHLSFAYENDQDLQEKYLKNAFFYHHSKDVINATDGTTISEEVLALARELKEKADDPKMQILLLLIQLKENSKLTATYHNKVKSLFNRLTATEKIGIEHPSKTLETTSPSPLVNASLRISTSTTQLSSSLSPTVQRPQHIMLSYCWKASAQPELVKRLHAELAVKGYNVWRDEEGSLLVPSIHGSVDDRMAEAVENSAVVIICVSAAYKLSANCRMEAKYASLRAKRDFLKILFVMMNEDYTTLSIPEACDGWLGIMIGKFSITFPRFIFLL